MDIKTLTQPNTLERYAFLWSEARLLIAALALFLGGVPPALYFLPSMYGVILPLLNLAWIISGVAAAYLLYRWNAVGKKVFGTYDRKETVSFFVLVISGLNLGLAGLIGRNIGMTLSNSHTVFMLAGVVYLLTAIFLWKRWKERGERLF